MKRLQEEDRVSPLRLGQRVRLVLLCLLAIVAAYSGMSFLPTSKAVAVKQLATGSGHIKCATCGEEYRNFAFSAIKDADLEVNGQAQLNNRSVPVEDHVEVQCLRISGTTAFISGVITKSNSKVNPAFEFAEGTPVIFTVQDNGEGSNAPVPDMISLLYQTATSQDCMTTGPIADIPITNGNVQVRVK